MNNEKRSSESEIPELGPELQAAVSAVLGEPISSQAVARVNRRAAELEREFPISKMFQSRRRHMPWLAIAAGIMLVACITAIWPTPPTAFAQAIERLKAASDFRYKQLVYLSTQTAPVEVDVMVSEDGRERREMLDTVSIHDASGRARITLIERDKTAIVSASPDVASKLPARQSQWLNQLRSHGKNPDKELGVQNIGRHSCTGFEVKIQHSIFSIWVDDRSGELVQVEIVGMPEGSSVTKCVMKDFEFNQSFDESLFAYDPPAGYKTIESLQQAKLLPGEESLVEALRGYTKISGGSFPKSVADWGEWAVLLAEKEVSPQVSGEVMSRLGAVLPFLGSMSKEDYEYVGAGRSVQDDRTIVFWYRKTGQQYRAIYSDFSVANIQKADLPLK